MIHRLQSLIDRGIITVDDSGVVYLTRQAWRNATAGTPYEEFEFVSAPPLCAWHTGTHYRKPTLHFVGFKDDRYTAAVKVWGKPDFIHRFWDARAVCEVCDGDKVVFATGDEHSDVKPFAYDDSAYF